MDICMNDCGVNGNSFRVDGGVEEEIGADRVANFAVNDMWIGRTGDNAVAGETQQINIPDVAAGTQICMRSKIYPANSGADDNYSDIEGSGTWAYSTPVCFNVAKKPSLQIWGGNTYVNGKVETIVARKVNVSGYADRGLNGKNGNTYVFGSWTELGLLATGSVKGLSSANNLGYAANTNGVLGATASSPGGGINNVNICLRSQLTFANVGFTGECQGVDPVGSLGSSVVSNTTKDDKSGLLGIYKYDGADNASNTIYLNDNTPDRFQNGAYYYKNSGNVQLGNQTVAKNTTQIVQANNVYITGNITYDATDGYQSFSNMPKLIIYAENNIGIDCSVSRIDAVLVAEGVVKTCVTNANLETPSDENSADRSRAQLKINGMVIAGELDAARTYGAATGANSIIPAEIINFDPTLYRFGGDDGSTDEGGGGDASIDLDVTYQAELAPRY